MELEAYPDNTFQEYLKFISKYGKTNQSQDEFYRRYAVFRKNYKRIVDHNAIPDSGFELEVNRFADLTDEEFIAKYTGLVVPEKRRIAMEGVVIAEDSENLNFLQDEKEERSLGEELPEYLNWHDKGFVTNPIDQASCGGCWAFSSISATETLAYMSGVVPQLTEFSIQQLLDCDDQNYGCTGGWMYQGFMYISNNGVFKRSDYTDYKFRQGTCSARPDDLNSKALMKDIGYVEHDGRTNQELKVLLQKQPLSIGMFTTGMMAAYK
jgi:cathepsin K